MSQSKEPMNTREKWLKEFRSNFGAILANYNLQGFDHQILLKVLVREFAHFLQAYKDSLKKRIEKKRKKYKHDAGYVCTLCESMEADSGCVCEGYNQALDDC